MILVWVLVLRVGLLFDSDLEGFVVVIEVDRGVFFMFKDCVFLYFDCVVDCVDGC